MGAPDATSCCTTSPLHAREGRGENWGVVQRLDNPPPRARGAGPVAGPTVSDARCITRGESSGVPIPLGWVPWSRLCRRRRPVRRRWRSVANALRQGLSAKARQVPLRWRSAGALARRPAQSRTGIAERFTL